ncbi:MAG: HD-GYP domain-containing protein [Acidimicrobiia bacterium]|nr:HD-GYP domain-containing protein [Acidimicrobiia bacterium]
MPRIDLNRLFIGGLYALSGAAAIVWLAQVESFPLTLTWPVFAAAFVYFHWQSVEVNDRLLASPSVMVILTAAVVFGPGQAMLGTAVMAALGAINPADIRRRRIFQLFANFGQLVLSAVMGSWLVELTLPASIAPGTMTTVALASAIGAVGYGVVNICLVIAGIRLALRRQNVWPWSGMARLIPSNLIMGFLGGLLGATMVLVGPVTLPLILVVFFVGHLSMDSYARLREAQLDTLAGFTKALEAKDPYTAGHTERVAYFSQLIGVEMGFKGADLERIRVASLIHDIGKLAIPSDLLRKQGRLTTDEYDLMQDHAHMVEEVLGEVEFLRPMLEIASGHHSHFDGAGYGGSGHTEGERPGIEARVLAVADAFDAMTSTRPYRKALTQKYALAELKDKAGTQFDPHCVEALEAALERTGEVYGSTVIESDEVARKIAERNVNFEAPAPEPLVAEDTSDGRTASRG